MALGTTIEDFTGRLLRDTFGCDLSDRDAFLLFAILHYYQIELSGAVITNRPNLTTGDRLHADTQRGCAEALASLWRGSGDERCDYAHWYWRWNTDWGAEGHAENLSVDERTRLGELMAMLKRHPFVRDLVAEDCDLLGKLE